MVAGLTAMAIIASLRIIGTDLAGTFTDVRSGLVALDTPTP